MLNYVWDLYFGPFYTQLYEKRWLGGFIWQIIYRTSDLGSFAPNYIPKGILEDFHAKLPMDLWVWVTLYQIIWVSCGRLFFHYAYKNLNYTIL